MASQPPKQLERTPLSKGDIEMSMKEFTPNQRALLKTVCEMGLPVLVVGKDYSGIKEIKGVIESVAPRREVVDAFENEEVVFNESDYSLPDSVFVLSHISNELSNYIGEYMRVDLFSTRYSNEVSIRISEVFRDKGTTTISFSENEYSMIVYDNTDNKYKFRIGGRTTALTEKGLDTTYGDMYLTNQQQLIQYLNLNQSKVELYMALGVRSLERPEKVVVLDLRGVKVEIKQLSKQLEFMLRTIMSFGVKLAVITDSVKLLDGLDIDLFDKYFDSDTTNHRCLNPL